MRIVVAVKDAEAADWLAGILARAGFSIAVLPEPTSTSAELRGAELVIADSEAAAALGDAGPRRRLLLAARGGTLDLSALKGRFADVLPFPSDDEDVVARVRYALRQPPSATEAS